LLAWGGSSVKSATGFHFGDDIVQSEANNIHWKDSNKFEVFKEMNYCSFKHKLMAFYLCYWLVYVCPMSL
jgi:hypothetical protein